MLGVVDEVASMNFTLADASALLRKSDNAVLGRRCFKIIGTDRKSVV